MTYRQKVKRAEIVIRDLGLENCQNTRVGGLFVPGISGGERKRTSIGFEILVDPSLLLLDEPTSGLDSSTALKLLQVLHKNAKAGRTIITTIHQPSSPLFHMFDKLILISEGHPIYSGEAKEAMKYFSTLQFVPQLAMNPADFLLDLATGNVKDITLPQKLQRLQDATMWETKLEEASSCRRQFTPVAPLVKSNSCHRKLSDHIQVFNEATSINPDLQGTEQEFSREIVKHIPGFIKWLKYASFVFYGFRLLLKVQYSPAQTYECSEPGGCKSLQESPSFAGIIDLNGGIMETWIMILMAVVFRVFAYIFLRRIKIQT